MKKNPKLKIIILFCLFARHLKGDGKDIYYHMEKAESKEKGHIKIVF